MTIVILVEKDPEILKGRARSRNAPLDDRWRCFELYSQDFACVSMHIHPVSRIPETCRHIFLRPPAAIRPPSKKNTNTMADITSGPTIPIPETDYLSYIFEGPYDEKKAWPSTKPILVSTEASDPSYTIDDIKDFVKRLGCGLHHIGARGRRVMLYGEANIHFPLALLGAMAAGSACAVIPPSSVHHITFYLRQMEAGFILCGLNDVTRARDAARQVGISPGHIFVVDRSVSDVGFTNEQQVRHWSWLLNVPGGSEYVWPRLRAESKEAEAILLCTSGYVTTLAFYQCALNAS